MYFFNNKSKYSQMGEAILSLIKTSYDNLQGILDWYDNIPETHEEKEKMKNEIIPKIIEFNKSFSNILIIINSLNNNSNNFKILYKKLFPIQNTAFNKISISNNLAILKEIIENFSEYDIQETIQKKK